MRGVSTYAFERALHSYFRNEAHYLLNRGILIADSAVPLFRDAVQGMRKAGERPTVDAVAELEMRRAMRAIGTVNQPKGKHGHETLTPAELAKAAKLDKALARPLSQVAARLQTPARK